MPFSYVVAWSRGHRILSPSAPVLNEPRFGHTAWPHGHARTVIQQAQHLLYEKNSTLHNYLILLALWLMVFSASSQVMIVAPILPRIGEALAVHQSLLGTLVTSYAVMLSVFALITGPISDRIGRRSVLLMGSGAMAVALYFHGLADSYISLLTVRALAGAAGGMLSGAAVAYVGDYFPYHRRGWANGWIMSGIAVGQIIGIPAGTIIADQMGFRWPFLLFGIVMTISTLMIWRFVPQPDVDRDPHPLSIRRAIKNYLILVREPAVGMGTAAYFLMFFSVGLYVIYLPTWLEETLGVGGEEIASLFLAGGLASVVAGPLAGRLSDSVGRKPLIVSSCIGLGIAMLLTTSVVTTMLAAYLIFAGTMVMVGMRISPFQSLMSELVTAERRGILMSLAVGIGQIGIGISGMVAGIMYTDFGYLSNTVMGAVSILLMAFLVRQYLPEPELRPERTVSDVERLAAVPESD